MHIIICAAMIIAAYLIGSIPFGLLIGKFYGVDIRTVGSKNIGATNVTRCIGSIPGKVCFLLDFIKGAAPAIAAQLIVPDAGWLALACCAGAILGHIFPVYLKFKGGKGVSTAAGAALALAPLPLLCALALWIAVFFIGRYVSLASIIAAASLPGFAFLFRWLNIGSTAAKSWESFGFFCVIAVLAIMRHRENIKRLFAGTESRFEKKK